MKTKIVSAAVAAGMDEADVSQVDGHMAEQPLAVME